MQLRRLAALERQKIIDDHAELELEIADFKDILANDPSASGRSSRDELGAIVEKYGDERRTRSSPADGDMSMEDLIPDEDVVVTITRGGYAKRTRADQYRIAAARRQGRARRDPARRRRRRALHRHHHPPLAAVLHQPRPGLPHQGLRPARGRRATPRASTSPNLLAFQPDEEIAQVLAIRDYEQAPYLVLATRNGLVKKTRARRLRQPPPGGRHRDQPPRGRRRADRRRAGRRPSDDLLLVSRKGQSIRFHADDAQLRPMGRATSGVTGMKFRDGDSLLSMSVIRAGRPTAEACCRRRSSPGSPSAREVHDWTGQGPRPSTASPSRSAVRRRRGDLVGALHRRRERRGARRSFERGNIVRSPVDEVPRSPAATRWA